MASGELLLPESAQTDLAVGLYEQGLFGIKEDPEDYIKLKSERMSPHYLDIRPGISNTASRALIVDSMVQLLGPAAVRRGCDYPHEAYAHIAGTPEAMTSYAAIIGERMGMSILQPRVDTKKATGNKTPILGKYLPDDFVAEFDDVVTDGASKIDTIASLEAAGLVVADYFVVVDREEGGAPQVQEVTGVEITPAIGVATLVTILRAENVITDTQYDNVAEYIREYGDPHAQATLGVAA